MVKRRWDNSNALYRWMHKGKQRKDPKRLYTPASNKGSMARRARHSRRSARSYSRGGRGRRGSGGSSLGGWTSILSAALYGAVRAPLSKAAAPMVEKLPFGNYNHEAVFGGLATVIPMVVKNKTIAAAMKPVQLIELASAAEETVQRFNSGTANGTASGGEVF